MDESAARPDELRRASSVFHDAAARLDLLYSSALLGHDQAEAMAAIGGGQNTWNEPIAAARAYEEMVRAWRVPLRRLCDVLAGASVVLKETAEGYERACGLEASAQ
ncbi:MAG: hypothetical protein JWM18_612 [Chloroflexi bacterium]|jgi:hypothetical protein|nr:hypothetical protein [Chloroflexota bacterium]